MIRLVESERQPWHRLPDETEEQYALFLLWLMGPRPRGLPEAPELANQKNWSERATAYDAVEDSSVYSTRDKLTNAIGNLTEIFYVGTLKKLRELRSSRTADMSIRDLANLAIVVKALKENITPILGEGGDIDLDALDEEDLRKVQEALNVVKKVAK